MGNGKSELLIRMESGWPNNNFLLTINYFETRIGYFSACKPWTIIGNKLYLR